MPLVIRGVAGSFRATREEGYMFFAHCSTMQMSEIREISNIDRQKLLIIADWMVHQDMMTEYNNQVPAM